MFYWQFDHICNSCFIGLVVNMGVGDGYHDHTMWHLSRLLTPHTININKHNTYTLNVWLKDEFPQGRSVHRHGLRFITSIMSLNNIIIILVPFNLSVATTLEAACMYLTHHPIQHDPLVVNSLIVLRDTYNTNSANVRHLHLSSTLHSTLFIC